MGGCLSTKVLSFHRDEPLAIKLLDGQLAVYNIDVAFAIGLRMTILTNDEHVLGSGKRQGRGAWTLSVENGRMMIKLAETFLFFSFSLVNSH